MRRGGKEKAEKVLCFSCIVLSYNRSNCEQVHSRYITKQEAACRVGERVLSVILILYYSDLVLDLFVLCVFSVETGSCCFRGFRPADSRPVETCFEDLPEICKMWRQLSRHTAV